MIPLAIGIGFLGLIAMRRAHHRCGGYDHGYGMSWGGGGHGHGHGWGGPPWHHGRHGHRGGRRRWMLNAALARIDASPAQERAIIAEIEKVEERLHSAKSSLRDVRGDLANAMRGPSLDDAALGAVLGRTDTATGEMRAAVLDAVRNIHGVLDDRQRGQVADLLERGIGRGWRGHGGGGGGPYRV